MSDRRQGLLCAFGVLFVWAGFLLFSRLSAAQALTAWDVGALRYAGSFLAILPVVAWRGLPALPLRRALALTATAGFGFPLCAYAGFGLAPAAHGAVLLPGLLPFLAAATWWMAFGEPFGRARLLSLALVASGMALIASETFRADAGAWRGDLLFVAGCVSWTAYMVLLRRWGVGALDATCAIALLAAPLYLPLWWLFLPSTIGEAAPGAVVFQLAYQGGFAMVLAGLMFTQAVVKLGGPMTSTITAAVPALVVLGAWPLLGETLALGGLTGIGLVTLGMAAGALTLPRPALTSRG